VEPSTALVVVRFGGVIAETRSALRVLETSHPPTWYLPVESFTEGALRPADGSSWCEFKGRAAYHDIVADDGRVARRSAWHYPSPSRGFEVLVGHVALYAAPLDEVTVDGVPVEPQPGGFYGGWVTPDVVGPFKGGPGSTGW
jgi:uncharacterized protein (DUF427 family)